VGAKARGRWLGEGEEHPGLVAGVQAGRVEGAEEGISSGEEEAWPSRGRAVFACEEASTSEGRD